MNSKQTIKLVIVVVSATLLQSCTSVSKFSTAKTIDIAASVNQKPTLADLEVRETKVSGTASYKSTEKGFEAIKQEAVANALKSVNADILVEPKYDTEVKSSTTTITVTGYPGFYKNFRAVKVEDLPVLESVIFTGIPKIIVPASNIPASNGAKNILGGVLNPK